jgi:hypothetical protein
LWQASSRAASGCRRRLRGRSPRHVLAPRLGRLVHLARLAALAATCGESGLPLLPVTLAGLPLFPSEMQLPADGDRPLERLWFVAIDDLEATYRLFDRHRGKI